MYYEVRDASEVLTKRVEYAYNAGGHVKYIVTNNAPQATTQVREGVALFYTRGGQLWLAVKEQWEVVESEGSYSIANHERLAATEYLTDGVGIARWLVRSLDPQTAKPGATLNPNDPLTWALLTEPGTGRAYERLTDFDGDARYQDYSVLQADETLVADPTRRYFGAWGHVDLPNETHYSTFSNQVGSAELVTFADGSQAGRMRYSAFGEPLSATGGAGGVRGVPDHGGVMGTFYFAAFFRGWLRGFRGDSIPNRPVDNSERPPVPCRAGGSGDL